MKRILLISIVVFCMVKLYSQHQEDIIKTSNGDLKITFLGHGSLYLTHNNKVYHVDPVNFYADYSKLPKADVILVTHEHMDHFQESTIEKLMKKGTQLVFTKLCAEKFSGEGLVLENGDGMVAGGVKVKAVPAYNLVHKRENGEQYHARGDGNGYVLDFEDKRIYVAGDTENIPEMKDLEDVDIAFLPMNLPYTMTPEMVVEAVKMFKPKVLYPYHYGKTDTGELLELMKEESYCEVRIRDMK